MRQQLVEMREKLKEAAMKYRLLKVGEIIKDGDEFLKSCGVWCLTHCEGAKIMELDTYRRPIKSTSRTSTNSRLRKCPHCGKVIKAGTSKSGGRCK